MVTLGKNKRAAEEDLYFSFILSYSVKVLKPFTFITFILMKKFKNLFLLVVYYIVFKINFFPRKLVYSLSLDWNILKGRLFMCFI